MKRMDDGDGSIRERYFILCMINIQVDNVWDLQHSTVCDNAFRRKTDNVCVCFVMYVY